MTNRGNVDETVTQVDVAKHAGVSRAVVSYVLNDGPRKVADETRQRVLDAIKELGYRPNKHAQRLKSSSHVAQNSIGIITGGHGYNLLERPYYNQVLAGLFDTAHQLNHHIRFFSFFEAFKDPVFFNKNIHPDEISSLIFLLPSFMMDDPENEVLLHEIVERIDNIICLEESILNLPTVLFDRAAAARLAVEHLISLGHRRIAFLAIHDERLTGYKQSLLEHNIAYDENLVHIIDAMYPLDTAYQLAIELSEVDDPPTAIFTANDESAISAISALRHCGLRVPEDIAITSIDNIPLARMVQPALTTVNVPTKEMATLAIQSLITQREFTRPQPATMVLPIELIIRESCGARLSSTP